MPKQGLQQSIARDQRSWRVNTGVMPHKRTTQRQPPTLHASRNLDCLFAVRPGDIHHTWTEQFHVVGFGCELRFQALDSPHAWHKFGLPHHGFGGWPWPRGDL